MKPTNPSPCGYQLRVPLKTINFPPLHPHLRCKIGIQQGGHAHQDHIPRVRHVAQEVFFVGRKNGVGSGGRLANGSKNLFVHLFQIVSWFSKDPKKIRAITSAWKLEESSRDLPKRLPHRYWYTVRVKPPQTISNLSDLPL